MMDDSPFDDIASALVREYLASKKLLRTICCMNEEKPKPADCIRKRSELAKSLKIEELVKKNREQQKPQKSMLEVVVKHLIEIGERNSSDGKINLKGILLTDMAQAQKIMGRLFVDNRSSEHRFADSNSSLKDSDTENGKICSSQTNSTSRPAKSCLSEKLSESEKTNYIPTIKSFSKQWSSDKSLDNEKSRKLFEMEKAKAICVPQFDGSIPMKPKAAKLTSMTCSQNAQHHDLTVDDLSDDDDLDCIEIPAASKSHSNKQQMNTARSSFPITRNTAKDLKTLLFGTSNMNFNDEWKRQNFKFSSNPNLYYGLVQNKGGPCGIIACVQSYVIRELLFPKVGPPIGLCPTVLQQNSVLKAAFCAILWKIGSKKRATIAFFQDKPSCVGPKNEKNIESLQLINCQTLEELDCFMEKCLSLFQNDNGGGCIMLLCSAVLTRTIEKIRTDMDEYDAHLMGVHGYCTQEMVNLFLTGRASSNMHDGIVKLDCGGPDLTLLRGVMCQSEIGFLSLFEHYNSCKVGSFLKDPVYPIWVVCSESHFTVLFSTDDSLTQEDCSTLSLFELIYYDSLANQDNEIKLIIDLDKQVPKCDDQYTPPLELCIRTKWPGASVEWVGSEPLL